MCFNSQFHLCGGGSGGGGVASLLPQLAQGATQSIAGSVMSGLAASGLKPSVLPVVALSALALYYFSAMTVLAYLGYKRYPAFMAIAGALHAALAGAAYAPTRTARAAALFLLTGAWAVTTGFVSLSLAAVESSTDIEEDFLKVANSVTTLFGLLWLILLVAIAGHCVTQLWGGASTKSAAGQDPEAGTVNNGAYTEYH